MGLFTVEVDEYKERAIGVLVHANNIATQIKKLFYSGRESVFGIPGYKVADAQKLLDAMEEISPGSVVKSFQMHSALGSFLNAVSPETIPGKDLESPVEYKVGMVSGAPKIVLTGAKYPTESE